MKKINTNIGSGHIDQFLELSIPNYFMMMQMIATDAADESHIGREETLSKGMFWVITRIDADIVKTPTYGQEVTLETYPGDDMKLLFPRYFKLCDKEGNTLIRSSSIWAVLDKETRKPVVKPFDSVPESEHYEGENPLPGKVKIPSELIKVESRKVRFSEIDLNGHLNNTKYMDFMIDVHDSDFYKKHRIKHVLVNYMKEVRDGDVVELFSNGLNPEVIVGKIDDQLIFATEVTYEER